MSDHNDFDKELAALISAEVECILAETRADTTLSPVGDGDPPSRQTTAVPEEDDIPVISMLPDVTDPEGLPLTDEDDFADVDAAPDAPVGDGDPPSPAGENFTLTDEELEAITRQSIDALLSEEPAEAPDEPRRVPVKAIVLGGLAVILLLVVAVFGAAAVKVRDLDTIYPKLTVMDVSIGGMTVEEAQEALEDAAIGDPEAIAITMEMPGGQLELTYADVGWMYNAEEIAALAFDYGRSDSTIGNLLQYIRAASTGVDFTSYVMDLPNEGYLEALLEGAIIKAEVALNEDVQFDYEAQTMTLIKGGQGIQLERKAMLKLLTKAVNGLDYTTIVYEPTARTETITTVAQLREQYGREVVSAAYVKETGTITEEVIGIDFDDEAVQPVWDAAELGDTVTLPIVVTQPEYTKAWLEENLFSKTLGESTTSIRTSGANRKTNIQLAAKAIDGTILMPGEQFSYNDALGQRTAERGYKLASAYMAGEVVESYGGGICQVSSGLYYSALLSNLQIDDRSNHTFKVGYMPFSYDATVSWGGPEFKFTNSRDLPVRINATVTDNDVTISISGTDDGTYVKLSYSVFNTYTDPDYPEVHTGYVSQATRRVYDSATNALLKTENMGKDYYRLHDEEIVYPSPSPTVTPSPTPTPTPEVTPTPTPVPTVEPTPEPTVEPTPTPEPTPVPETPADQSGGEQTPTDQVITE